MNSGSSLAEQINAFVAAGGVSALVMAFAAAYRTWHESAKPTPAKPSPLEAENEQLRKRLEELERKERK
jgi:cell shape-determining protein MreC